MGLSTVQIILLVIFGCVAGMGSVLDSFQTHRPLVACTIVGAILGDRLESPVERRRVSVITAD